LVDLEDIFTIDFNKCRTFDDFQIDAFLNLDGFCGNYYLRIKTHSEDVALGWEEKVEDIEFGDRDSLSKFGDCEVANKEDNSHVSLEPAPIGCKKHQLEVQIYPCSGRDPNECFDLFLNFNIEICCKCEIDVEVEEGDADFGGLVK
jgi:hypothetical protein